MSTFVLFQKNINKDQSRDTGMAVVLLLLIVYLSSRRNGLVLAAVVLHLVNMIAPQVYRPVASVWLGLSNLMGTAVSKVLLSIVFFAASMSSGFG